MPRLQWSRGSWAGERAETARGKKGLTLSSRTAGCRACLSARLRVHVCVCTCVSAMAYPYPALFPLCMWDAAGRWKVVWHLSVWHYQWCVSERQECVGVQTWARGGGGGGGGWRKRVCECLCGLAAAVVVVWGEGGISTEPHSRWCRCEWVFSVSARPGLSSSRAQVRGIHLCLTLHWGFRCLLAHYRLRAKLWTFVCIQHKWHQARPRFLYVAKFSSAKVQAVSCRSHASSSRIAHHTVEERG